MKIKTINIPIYSDSVTFLFGDNKESKKILVDRFKEREEDAEYMFDSVTNSIGLFCYFDRSRNYYIWMPCIPSKVEETGILIHELQHFVWKILDNKGMTHSEDSDESYSYLLEYVYIEIQKWINRNGKY